MAKQPFACIVENKRQVWYRTLLEAIEISDTLQSANVPHRVLARDVHGNMVDVGKSWLPDCVCGQEDTFGGIVDNQYEAVVEAPATEVPGVAA